MKRTLYALVPWMVLATAASGQVRSADVAYAFTQAIPTRAYRLGDECFVSIDGAALWGWRLDVRGDEANVTAEGKTFRVPLRSIAGRPSLALRRTVTQLGGDSSWIAGLDTLEVWSNLTRVSYRNGRLQAVSPLSMKAIVTPQKNSEQVFVDLDGVRLSKTTELDLDEGVKAVQIRPNTVRITIPTAEGADVAAFTNAQTRSLDAVLTDAGTGVRLPDNGNHETNTTEPVPTPTDPTPPITTPPTTTTDKGPLPLFVDIESPQAALLAIKLPNLAGVTFSKPDPAILEVKLPGIYQRLADGFHLDTDAVVGVSTRVYDGGSFLTLQLSRPMGAEVWSDGNGVQIQLLKPDVGNGRLAGKVVVVDPGHGGRDQGAHSGGVNEKDLTLTIGRLLSQELASQGATVIMTRKTDVFIPLGTRADMANRNKADFFLSVHINSTSGSSGMSGTITFHHKGKEISRVLAECIQKQVAKVNGLPNVGVWSDGRIYQSGFAVLRQTTMPGVLCELGFINNSRDRARMSTQDFQSSVAKAIVRGVKDYLGDE